MAGVNMALFADKGDTQTHDEPAFMSTHTLPLESSVDVHPQPHYAMPESMQLSVDYGHTTTEVDVDVDVDASDSKMERQPAEVFGDWSDSPIDQ
jgi:hypothetical protein